MFTRIFVALLFVFQIGYSQTEKKNIQVIAKPKKEGMWLRWAPIDPTVWQLGNKYGYTVERFTIKSDGELENRAGEKLTAQPLKPHSRAELEKLASTVKEADVLIELIYGEEVNTNVKSNDPASVLARSEEVENKFGVALLVCDLSTEVANAAGLFLSDKTAEKGKRYIYRISLAQQPKGTVIEPGVVVIDMGDEKPLAEIKDLQSEFRDRSVMLSWSTLMHQGIYSFYYIEKSSDGKVFNKVSDLPYVHVSESPESETAFFVDSIEMNMQTYHYRIIGVTPFGETGQASNIVKGEGKDNLSGLLIIREIKIVEAVTAATPIEQPKKSKRTTRQSKDEKTSSEVKGSKVNIAWEFPVEEEGKINGFVVSKSNTAGGPYTDVTKSALPKDVRSYADQTSYNNTYYQLKAVDKLGNEVSRSYPFLVQVEDNTPPAVPSGIAGSMDKAGIASLHWSPNTDQDIMGYRLFRSNSLREEPVEITRKILTDTLFTDTVNINVLNKDVYYHVIAVDRNYNASDYSKPLKLLRPDIIPPAAPVFTKSEVRKDTILLEWKNSISDDIAKYEFIRIEEGGRERRTIFTWTQASLRSAYSDASLTPGKDYQYKLIAYDSAGNLSEAITRRIIFEPGYRAAVTEIKTNVDRENKLITIQWKNAQPAVKVIIYRKVNDGQIIMYKTLDSDVNSFIDKNVNINNVYTYKVQLIHPKSIKSLLSEEIKVTY
jgi:hypothetical protein